MRVVTPLSSRKISFSGGIVASRLTNSSRRRRSCSVSRSVAWSDFFQLQPHPLQSPSHLGKADRQSLFLFKLFAQLAQRQIGNRDQPTPQLFTVLVQQLARRAPALLDPFHLPGAPKLPPQLLPISKTDHEPLGQLLQCRLTPLIGGQEPPPKIIRKCLRHGITIREPPPN